jgi:hypothetical protein
MQLFYAGTLKKGGQSGHKAEDRHLNTFATECTAIIIIDSILP